jgi:hypothetical protein
MGVSYLALVEVSVLRLGLPLVGLFEKKVWEFPPIACDVVKQGLRLSRLRHGNWCVEALKSLTTLKWTTTQRSE